MLNDTRRVDVYRNALRDAVNGKVVADVGAGTGLLSIMSAEAGASKVYAIEFSKIVKECRKAISSKGLEKIVKVMNIRAEEAPLMENSVDVVVSEWMGYFLIFERMLPSVVAVRNKCLRPDGIMIPRRSKLFLAAFSREDSPEP